ncbi:carboxylate-amine ligase [Nocardiopsis potens]|uniref:carboxylate-amine ligase n=1 Tax=Nocardiopsis potens TaxID=1246458 RepID=UPI0003463CF8|nr:glutamate--cysteine ligase [Nocardiopsis potens]
MIESDRPRSGSRPAAAHSAAAHSPSRQPGTLHRPFQEEAPDRVAPPAPAPRPAPAPTFGVEEEFFVVDPETRRAAPLAPAVLESAALSRHDGAETGSALCAEMTRFQVEAASPVCRTGDELDRCLARARTALAEAAAEHGLAITATGTAVLGDVGCAPLTSGARYRRIAEEFGALRDAHAVCGCHVHIGVPTVAAALEAGNLLRRRLPALLALTANSPFLRGRDTGHASWRAVTWSRLPSAGPPPRFARTGDYDRAVAELAEAGAILDRRMVYWDVRPSPHLPTVEIRPCDVAATAEEAVLTALVIRGLVAAGADGTGDGPEPDDRLLRLAMWRAARDGLEGALLDPATGAALPARAEVEAMLAAAEPGLASAGDRARVAALYRRVAAVGSGAHRQRVAYTRRGRMSDVVDLLIRQTRHGLDAAEG